MCMCVCRQEDIVCEWACTIYSTRNSIAKKLNGGHFESVFDWFALSTNTIFQGTWHMAQKGRGKDNIPLCTKFENGTHTHTHSYRGRFAAGNGGGGLWLLSDAHENQQISFFFPLLCRHTVKATTTREQQLCCRRQQQSNDNGNNNHKGTKTTATQRQQYRSRQAKTPVLPNWLFISQAKLVSEVQIINIY